jgi:hypothetical protein
MAIQTTAQALIRESLLLIGAIAAGEQPTAAESSDAFARLNALVDYWSTQRLTQRVVGREVFDLVTGQSTYTVGVGADFDMIRPEFVETVTLLLTTTTPPVELPLSPLTEQAYQSVRIKTLENGQPTAYFFDATMPDAEIFVWPTPDNDVNDLVIYSPQAFAQFATLTTSYLLAPGYARALRTNLAVELAPEWGRQVSQQIVMMAAEALAAIKQLNVQMADLGVDPALAGSGRSGWNIYTGP